jgi:signal transduction histidine kinase
MPGGGKLDVVMEAGDEFITVAVTDEGEGICPEHIEKIFDPFFSTKDRGTGLGLTIAHKIMQCHNGFIKAFKNDGKGSTFCLYFPKNNNTLNVSSVRAGLKPAPTNRGIIEGSISGAGI